MTVSLCAQDIYLPFQHLSQDDGLTEGTNSYVFQDSRGFIWISSVAGLNRFDGKQVKTYLPQPSDSTALAGGLINSTFFEDTTGDIWFTCNVAVEHYVRQKDQFETLRLFNAQGGLVSEDIMAFHLDTDGNLWLRAGGGADGRLHLLNIYSGRDSILCPLDGQRCGVITDYEGHVSKVISSLFLNRWGFDITDTRSGEQVQYYMKHTGRDSLMTTNIWVESPHSVWFGSNHGLLHFNPVSRSSEIFNTFRGQVGFVWSVVPWKDNLLLVGTSQEGLLLFDRSTGSFTQQFSHQADSPYSLRQDNVHELYVDHDGVLWASLWSIGLDYVGLASIKFKTPDPEFNRRPVWSVIEGPDGETWCTTDQGYLLFDQRHRPITRDFGIPDFDQLIKQYRVPLFFKDRQHHIWLSIGNDLFSYDPISSKMVKAAVLPDVPKSWITLSNGRSFISTNQGVFELSNDDHQIQLITKAPEFRRFQNISFETLYEDSHGYFYAAKNSESLVIFRIDQDSLTYLTEINGVGACNAFLEQKEPDSIWVCTDDGVIALSKSTFHYRHLTLARDGLPQEMYYSIIRDKNGILWLSGNQGIVRNDPGAHSSIRYTRTDGLESVQFNPHGACLSSTGEIWYGGVHGVSVFTPEQIQPDQVTPQIQITEILVNDNPFPTDTYIGETTALSFPHNENTLSFEFAGLEFSDPKNLQYKYRMVGIDPGWVTSGNRSFVRYPNIPPGWYQFKVAAANSDGIWSPASRVLDIRITPPFTQTIWFYSLLVLCAASIAYLMYRFQLKRKLEIAEKKRLIELDVLKDRLYTNITHEFRTPLTLIHGPVANALSTDAPLGKKELKLIQTQSERLQHLIDQILDLRKAEAGKLQPQFVHGDIVRFIEYLTHSFELSAKEKGVLLLFSASARELYMDYDEEMLTQVISNLISNALKHTARNGKISVTVSVPVARNILDIRVQDTGAGIPSEDLPLIFDRYYQSPRSAVGGTGIGLALTKYLVELLGGSVAVESVVGFGTTFTVSLPIQSVAQATPKQLHSLTASPDQSNDRMEEPFAAGESADSGKPMILVVEDDKEVMQYILSCLQGSFSLMTSPDGNDGMQNAFEHIPDLIISDVMMPGKTGFELCAALKTDIQTSHIPIILLTGRRDQSSLMAGIEHGADAYVMKPFNPQELLLRVGKLLELRANLRQYYRHIASGEDLQSPVQASAKENAFLKDLRELVEARMSDSQFNTEMIAVHMAMSHSQLNRKINALTGEPISKFVRSVRLTRARELLKNPDLTISEIAYETGFSDPGYFTKVFSKEYEITPTEYRAGLGE